MENRVVVLMLCAILALSSADPETPRTCEPIKLELCRGIGYTQTSMPNLVGHDLQKDAQLQLQTFTPLIQYGCSSQLQFFLCSVYVPMCTEKVPTPIGPCRPLCESVRSRCQPVLQEFGFPWPSALNCSKFPPENNQNHMCMDGPGEESAPFPPLLPHGGNKNPPVVSSIPNKPKVKNPVAAPGFVGTGPCDRYRHAERYVYINRTGRCAQLCATNLAFSSEDKNFAEIWMAVWAVVCFLCTLFTALSFFIDGSRFKYPERPIIFLAFCYNIYSVGYGVRLIAGRKDVACVAEPHYGVDILIQEGLDHTNCAVVFLLLYFFGMAASVWWVLLTITWYTAISKRWSHDTIQRYSSFLHLGAWGLPAGQTIAILVLMAVDADELTGMCYVGNQSSSFLLGFIIVPHLIYLLLGLCFTVAGFASVYRLRHQLPVPVTAPASPVHPFNGPQQSRSAPANPKNDQFMIRVGVFSVLYALASASVLASHSYEYASRDSWLLANRNPARKPTIEVFMLKIFMSLVVGVICALWIWSEDTVLAWRKLGRRMMHRKQKTPPFLQPMHLKHQQLLLLDKQKRVKCSSKSGSETAV